MIILSIVFFIITVLALLWLDDKPNKPGTWTAMDPTTNTTLEFFLTEELHIFVAEDEKLIELDKWPGRTRFKGLTDWVHLQ